MSSRLDFAAKTFSGYGLADGKYLPCSGLSGRVVNLSPCSSHGNSKKLPKLNIFHLESKTVSASFVCNASSSNQWRNPSKHNRSGGFQNRNRQNEDRDEYDNIVESEMFSSKNGPMLTASNAAKHQATAAPGVREKKIVELFRKVQAQLRERAAGKEEEKVEEPKAKGKESETVDSLLKLLRKHSVQKDKKISTNADFGDSFSDERGSDISEYKRLRRLEWQESEAPVMNRPKSNFQKRSPVNRIKFQNRYSGEETLNAVEHDDIDGEGDNIKLGPKSLNADKSKAVTELESVIEPVFSDDDDEFDELSEDEEEDDDDDDDVDNDVNDEESNQVVSEKFDEMTVPELRALAKSRGAKGYSKMKKVELIELLSRN